MTKEEFVEYMIPRIRKASLILGQKVKFKDAEELESVAFYSLWQAVCDPAFESSKSLKEKESYCVGYVVNTMKNFIKVEGRFDRFRGR